MITNILLYLAAVDDEVTLGEAEFITDSSDKLSAICDAAGVKRSKTGLNPADYVTSGEAGFIDKVPRRPDTVNADGAPASVSAPAPETPKVKPGY